MTPDKSNETPKPVEIVRISLSLYDMISLVLTFWIASVVIGGVLGGMYMVLRQYALSS